MEPKPAVPDQKPLLRVNRVVKLQKIKFFSEENYNVKGDRIGKEHNFKNIMQNAVQTIQQIKEGTFSIAE